MTNNENSNGDGIKWRESDGGKQKSAS